MDDGAVLPPIELTRASLTVPLDRLRFGHEADPPINARQAERDEDVEALAASIAAPGIGLRQALDVVEKDGGIFVRDGNRRLAALRLLASRGRIAADAPIPCVTSDGNDLELSLVANVERVPLHPIDQYEAFAALADKTEAEIAARFGVDAKHVRRMLALGRLSPAVRKAWRAGKFGREAHQCAEAFTMAKSAAQQDRVLKKLTKSGYLYPHQIRKELGAGGSNDVRRMMIFVGKEAYKAAGGTMTEDLFGTDHIVDNPGLVAGLASQKLASEVERLTKEEGWSWASGAEDLPQDAGWSWRRLPMPARAPTKQESAKIRALNEEAEKIEDEADIGDDPPRLAEIQNEIDAIDSAIESRGWTAEAKAKAGCIVSIGYDGELEIRYGVLKPRATKPSKPDKAKAKKKPAAIDISSALRSDLAGRATRATAAAINADGRVALAALLAGHTYQRSIYDFSPVRVSEEGIDHRTYWQTAGSKRESFAAIFNRYLEMKESELLIVAAGIAGRALNFVHGDAAPFADKGVAAIATALPAEAINAAMVAAFDAEDFFRRAPMAIAAAALRDIEGKKAVIPKRKAEAAAAAVKAARAAGWLPKELRTVHYAGPGSRRKPTSASKEPDLGNTRDRRAVKKRAAKNA